MKRRFSKLPIASIAVVVGGLLIGLAMSPVGAQSALTNGVVTVRSDGAVYLISNGMRRWVATVQITDDELNAYPEAEPIYAGLAPFGSASASTSSSSNTASKTGTTVASKTGSGSSTVASKTGSTTSSSTSSSRSSSSNEDVEVQPGQTVIDPSSGADAKDPNDSSLAATTADLDPAAKAEPTGSTTCPSTHQIKGGFDKYYWDTDRPDYASVEPEACFVSGAYARAYGYTEVKKRPGGSAPAPKPTPTPTKKR